MARWVPARADVIGELADEILHNYRNGRAVVGVDGVPDAGQSAFADELADALRERDMVSYRATANARRDPDGEIVRSETIAPFRAGEGDFGDGGSAILVLDGTRLHGAELRSAFASTVWLSTPGREAGDVDPEQSAYERSSAPRIKATANIDATDPEHPRRTFADSC
ncbi:MAG: hypothetical protein ABWZ77_04080 [Naasia sp.]